MPNRPTAIAAATAPTLALWPGLASAHPGHWAAAGGHDHWIALGALGVAGLAAVAALVKDKRRRREEEAEEEGADDAPAHDEDAAGSEA